MKILMMLAAVWMLVATGTLITGKAKAALLRHERASGLDAELYAPAARLDPAQRPSSERRRRAFASEDRAGPTSGGRAAPWRSSANWARTRRHTSQIAR